MSDEPKDLTDKEKSESRVNKIFKYKIVVLITLVVLIAGFLVFISIGLYNSSGTAQLDLSRPEYSAVIDRIEYIDSSKYPNSGKLDERAIKEFEKLYDDRAETIVDIDAFSPGPLSDKTLGLPEVK